MAQDEETLRKLVLELRYFEGTAEVIQTRIGYINAAITELQVSNETISGLKSEEKGAQILVPIGGGSYIMTRIEDTSKIIVGIGSNVSTEKDTASAQEDIGTRILELEKIGASLQKQLDEVATQINKTQNQIQDFTRRQSEGRANV